MLHLIEASVTPLLKQKHAAAYTTSNVNQKFDAAMNKYRIADEVHMLAARTKAVPYLELKVSLCMDA